MKARYRQARRVSRRRLWVVRHRGIGPFKARRRQTGTSPKVFGIGLSKTGTTSLQVALEMIGYRAITHRHLAERGLEDWWKGDFREDYLFDVEAATDLPIASMYRELDIRYPGSKFILTERPIDAWLASIDRQFRANPNPPRFNVMTRVASYGYTVFNSTAFRRSYHRHAGEVREYFADRPDDLLIMNLFEGDGWDQLCRFLGRPIPTGPFPNVKPGGGGSAQRSRPMIEGPTNSILPRWAATVRNHTGLAAVIPLINPNHVNVLDYAEIEMLLRRTCRSIKAQRPRTIPTVIVGHQRPTWIDTLADFVLFVDVGLTRQLDGRLPGPLDKGIKMLIATMVAEKWCAAGSILTIDADDLVHVDLGAAVGAFLDEHADATGARWTRGVELGMQRLSDQTLAITSAQEINDFHRACGSCRAIRVDSLRRLLPRTFAHFSDLDGLLDEDSRYTVAGYLRLTSDTVDYIDERFGSAGSDIRSELHSFGRHVADPFGLTDLPLLGAAKSCGHGQHEGGNRGAIHVDSVVAVLELDRALATFGLLDGHDRYGIGA